VLRGHLSLIVALASGCHTLRWPQASTEATQERRRAARPPRIIPALIGDNAALPYKPSGDWGTLQLPHSPGVFTENPPRDCKLHAQVSKLQERIDHCAHPPKTNVNRSPIFCRLRRVRVGLSVRTHQHLALRPSDPLKCRSQARFRAVLHIEWALHFAALVQCHF